MCSEMSNPWWDMMTSSNGNIFRTTGPLWGDSTGDGWIPHTKTSNAELSCFLYAPEQTVEQTWNSLWRHHGSLHTHGQNSFIWHSWYSFVSQVSISAYLSRWRYYLNLIRTLENHRCQTRKHNTVRPVYNDYLMGYFSGFWSSPGWPRAT